MKRVGAAAAVLIGLILASVVPGAAADDAEPIHLTFHSPDGQPMSAATVGIFLHPFDHGHTFLPTRLLLGEADADGRFAFSLTDRPLAVAQSNLSVDGWINVEIRALDPQRRWMVSMPASLPVFDPHSQVLTANITFESDPLPSARTTEEIFKSTPVTGCNDADTEMPMCQELLRKRKRPVKIASLHIARSMRGTFAFRDARETSHETLVRACAPTQCDQWQAGAFRRENRRRGSESVIPRKGSYHRVMRATYEERKYRYCSSGQSFENCQHEVQYWEPHIWTGKINLKMKPNVPDAVRFDRSYAKPLHRGETFKTFSQDNQTFGKGLTLLAVELKSQTGYSQSTRLKWKGLSGCSKRWLYGNHKYPTEAGAIYARSRRCG